MTDIQIEATVCDKPHGLPSNRAEIYGHTASQTCVRVSEDVWVHSPHLPGQPPFDVWADQEEKA